MSFESLSVLGQTYCCPMLFGVAIPNDKVRDTDYRKIVPYVFDSITCENEMKPNFIRTASVARTTNYNRDDSYDYTNSDEIVEFAKEHRMKVVGHVLWYEPENLPQFVKDLSDNGSLNHTVMSNIVKNHITNVIRHFNSLAPTTVYSWQVLNEALDANGNIQTDQIIQRILGDASFSNLFQYAQNVITPPPAAAPAPAAAPINVNTKLYYNDFRNLSDNRIFDRLKTLKNSSGILDGVGIQCHGTASNILDAMTLKYVQEGFEVHFSEVDNASDINDYYLTIWYQDVIKIALKYGVKNFTVWGLTDDSSWLYDSDSIGRPYPANGRRYPLLFNDEFEPKSSYNALIQEIKLFGQQSYDIIIILGQSNSVGFGKTEYNKFDNPGGTYTINRNHDDYAHDFNNKFDERIRTFTSDNRIVPAFEQLDSGQGIGTRNMYGFGLSFARQYIKENKLGADRKILLISCGFGGTGFLSPSTKPNRWNHFLDNNLYDKAINRIKRVKSAINSNSEVKAILWHQGEDDIEAIFNPVIRRSPNYVGIFNSIRTIFGLRNEVSFIENDVEDLYSRSLTTVLNSIKTNLGSSSTLILLGGLCPSMYITHKITDTEYSNTKENFKNFPYTRFPLMNNLLLSIARNNGYRFVSAEPISTVSPHFNHYLKSNEDNDIIHFSKSSQIELGKRYFFVYNNTITLNNTTYSNNTYDVIVILGQSNSVGRGKSEHTFDNPNSVTYNMTSYSFYNDDFNKTINPNIKNFSRTSQIIDAVENPESSLENDRGDPGDYGFGISFARQYVKQNSGKKVLLINCGSGGTSISQWKTDATSNPNLYTRALVRIRSALSQINSSSTVKAILWHQGESDVNTNPTTYESQLTTMLNSLRKNIASPDTPILLGGLCPSKYIRHEIAPRYSTDSIDNNYSKMNTLISSIATKNSKNGYKFVSSDPITAITPHFNHYLKGNFNGGRGDIVHFNKSSQIEFGRRYFYVYNGSISLT